MPEDDENRGSGVSLDDPYRLAATHPFLGAASQKMLISRIYGEQDKDWFDAGRTYHPNKVCEQQIRLPSGQVRKVFFDESALDYGIPIPENLRGAFQKAAAKLPVPDTQLVSRFPLVEVKASTAAEAGKIIINHLTKAEEEGWVRGRAYFFVDDWRNDYELTRGDEKTVMSFDMRPALIADSRLNLMMFSSLNSIEAVNEVERRADALKKPSTNVVEMDSKRMLVSSVKFALVVAVVIGTVAFFMIRSFGGALVTATISFAIAIAWWHKAIREEAVSRGVELRIRRGTHDEKT